MDDIFRKIMQSDYRAQASNAKKGESDDEPFLFSFERDKENKESAQSTSQQNDQSKTNDRYRTNF